MHKKYKGNTKDCDGIQQARWFTLQVFGFVWLFLLIYQTQNHTARPESHIYLEMLSTPTTSATTTKRS
jgi:hypothetical protein